jgi:hypothetical protein
MNVPGHPPSESRPARTCRGIRKEGGREGGREGGKDRGRDGPGSVDTVMKARLLARCLHNSLPS